MVGKDSYVAKDGAGNLIVFWGTDHDIERIEFELIDDTWIQKDRKVGKNYNKKYDR